MAVIVSAAILSGVLVVTEGRSSDYWFVSAFFGVTAVLTAASKGLGQIVIMCIAAIGLIMLVIAAVAHAVPLTLMLLGTLGSLIVTETFSFGRARQKHP